MTHLETVQLDRRARDAFLDEEVADLCALITLKLDNLASFLVIDKGTIAGEFLLECLQEFLGIIFGWQSLQSGQSLPSVSLLNTNVDVVLLRTNVLVASKRISLVSKRIEGVEILYAHATMGCVPKKGVLGGKKREWR